jgi:hypothetical protein
MIMKLLTTVALVTAVMMTVQVVGDWPKPVPALDTLCFVWSSAFWALSALFQSLK